MRAQYIDSTKEYNGTLIVTIRLLPIKKSYVYLTQEDTLQNFINLSYKKGCSMKAFNDFKKRSTLIKNEGNV
jgi:hypothetical protein